MSWVISWRLPQSGKRFGHAAPAGRRPGQSAPFHIGFDPINALVMSLVVEEMAHRPVHGLEELSSRTRQRLLALFSALARTMPDDPAPADAIRRLGGTPPESLSARQLSQE